MIRSLALLLASALPLASACSDFLLNTTSDSVVSGRTMDFVVDLHTMVEVIPRGAKIQDTPVFNCSDCPDFEWETKHGFVAFNAFGINVATDGLNEAGLSAAWLYLDGTEYPVPDAVAHPDVHDDNAKPIVSSLCTYILGNFATVDEVREGITKVQLAEFTSINPEAASLGRIPLHVSVHDAQGKNLVIEFINGATNLYDNINDILTNDPPLDEQLAELEKNGFKDIPGGYGSTERFLRLSVLNRMAPQGYPLSGASYLVGTNEQKDISAVLHMINAVARPQGGEATEWSVVRDHGRKKLYIQSTNNQLLRTVDLNQIDFTGPHARRALPVTFGDWVIDVTPVLQSDVNVARTMDLPPRSQIKALAEYLKTHNTFPPAFAMTQSLSAFPPAHTIHMSKVNMIFGLGLVCGVVASALITLSSRIIQQRSRRHGYRSVRSDGDAFI